MAGGYGPGYGSGYSTFVTPTAPDPTPETSIPNVVCRRTGDFDLVHPTIKPYVKEKFFRETKNLNFRGELCLHLPKICDEDEGAEVADTFDPQTGAIFSREICDDGSINILCDPNENFGQKFKGGWKIGASPTLFRVFFEEEAASVSIEDGGVTETNIVIGRHLNDPVINFADLVLRTGNRLLTVLDRPRRREERGFLVHQETSYELLNQEHPFYKIEDCFPNTPPWDIVREFLLVVV